MSKTEYWTPDDEREFLRIVEDQVLNKNHTLSRALDEVAKALDRSKAACTYKYHKKIKSQLDYEVIFKIAQNNPAKNNPAKNNHTEEELTKSEHTQEEIKFEINVFQDVGIRILGLLKKMTSAQESLLEREKEIKITQFRLQELLAQRDELLEQRKILATDLAELQSKEGLE